jgi:hypothetical protein
MNESINSAYTVFERPPSFSWEVIMDGERGLRMDYWQKKGEEEI